MEDLVSFLVMDAAHSNRFHGLALRKSGTCVLEMDRNPSDPVQPHLMSQKLVGYNFESLCMVS